MNIRKLLPQVCTLTLVYLYSSNFCTAQQSVAGNYDYSNLQYVPLMGQEYVKAYQRSNPMTKMAVMKHDSAAQLSKHKLLSALQRNTLRPRKKKIWKIASELKARENIILKYLDTYLTKEEKQELALRMDQQRLDPSQVGYEKKSIALKLPKKRRRRNTDESMYNAAMAGLEILLLAI